MRIRPHVPWLAAIAGVLAVAALAGRVGADARWLAALGHMVVAHGSVPAGVPFAPRASLHWPNVPVLAELIFGWLESLMGDRGLMLAQLVAAAFGLWVMGRDAMARGAGAPGATRALLLAGIGSLGTLAIARSQLFSVALFPLLCWLLRGEAVQPSKRVWLAVPLLALWSNLHGGALLGLAVLLSYLGLSRFRIQRLTTIGVAVAGAGALCATPGLLHTVSYYHGLLTNQAAASGEAMWGPLSLASPLDVLLILCGLTLVVQFARSRPALWERAVVLGLGLLTVQAARNGVWLLFFLAPPAARSFAPRRQWAALVAPAGLAALVVFGCAIARGPVPDGAGRPLLARALRLAQGSPVLAAGSMEEQVALDGGSVVAGDPIDAFPPQVQSSYLAWLRGSRQALNRLDGGVRVVLVLRGSRAQRVMAATPAFLPAGGDSRALLYERRS